MDCEKNVKKDTWQRGFYKGRFIHLGMYIEDDFDEKDECKSPEDTKEFGQPRKYAKIEYIEEDKKFNPNENMK